MPRQNTWTVQRLIDFLQDCDPEASVLIATDDEYPWECALAGTCTRADILPDEDEDPEDKPPLPENDVILLTGQQLRMGDIGIHEAAR